jgi:flavin reductase (DIM6/NTAB) family NADH-FMN oxidoreductase RutF
MHPSSYIHAMGAAVTGVTVVTTIASDGRPLGQTVSAMCSVSAEPPLLHGAAARFRCEVHSTQVAGTHTLVLGAVTRAERGAATPLAYTRRGYVAPLSTERLAA